MIQRIGATADRIFRCPLDPGGKTILENIRLDVKPGEFLCNVGASGCGKATAACGRVISANRRRRELRLPAYLSAGAMLPGVIGNLTVLAMSVVEKRLLKWRSSGR
jgi:hypothetical protein